MYHDEHLHAKKLRCSKVIKVRNYIMYICKAYIIDFVV